MNTKIENAKTKIENGAKFNGIVYGKRANKNNVDLHIYLDGDYTSLMRVDPSDAEEIKSEILSFFGVLENKQDNIAGNFGVGCISTAEEANKYGFDAIEC